MPTTECSNATVEFFTPNDQCSRAVQSIYVADNNSAIIDLYFGDCPMRFLNYTIGCSSLFDTDTVSNI